MLARWAGGVGTFLGIALVVSHNNAPMDGKDSPILGDWSCSISDDRGSTSMNRTLLADGTMRGADHVSFRSKGHLLEMKRSVAGSWQATRAVFSLTTTSEERSAYALDGVLIPEEMVERRMPPPSPSANTYEIVTLDKDSLVYNTATGQVVCQR